MQNNRTISVLIVIVSLMVIGLVGYLVGFKDKEHEIVPVQVPTASSTAVVYSNTDYGFTFTLSDNWKGYSVIENMWEGNPLAPSVAKETGPKLLIRNPKWTSKLPYQDIPILVFTIEQWNSYVAENFSVSAAPIPASELGRNNVYVFALPPRWNFDFSEGYEEAEDIVNSNPLKGFDVEN